MRQSDTRTLARAFTLIELLVVIGIIAVLVAIGLTVAPSLLNSGRSQATQSVMIALESVLQELTSVGLAPKDYKAYRADLDGDGLETWFPLIDARAASSPVDRKTPPVPSLGRLLRVAKETAPGIETRWTQLDASSVRAGDIGNVAAFGPGGGRPQSLSGTEVLDQWGNPIRYVHPSFDGGGGSWFDSEGDPNPGTRDPISAATGKQTSVNQPPPNRDYRRSFRPFDPTDPMTPADAIGDADEGICPGGSSGYLYSAGPDGDPGTRADNVYASVQPEYPAETAGQE